MRIVLLISAVIISLLDSVNAENFTGNLECASVNDGTVVLTAIPGWVAVTNQNIPKLERHIVNCKANSAGSKVRNVFKASAGVAALGSAANLLLKLKHLKSMLGVLPALIATFVLGTVAVTTVGLAVTIPAYYAISWHSLCTKTLSESNFDPITWSVEHRTNATAEIVDLYGFKSQEEASKAFYLSAIMKDGQKLGSIKENRIGSGVKLRKGTVEPMFLGWVNSEWPVRATKGMYLQLILPIPGPGKAVPSRESVVVSPDGEIEISSDEGGSPIDDDDEEGSFTVWQVEHL